MSRSNLALKVCFFSALTLGLTAFLSSGDQAIAKWTYINPANGELKTFTSTLLPLVESKVDTTVSLDFTTGGGTSVTFTCSAFTVSGEPKLLENGTISTGIATFTGCETFLNGKLSAACLLKTGGNPFDTVGTNQVTGSLVLHGSGQAILMKPTVENAKGELIFTTIELGEECSIGERVSVTGYLMLGSSPSSPFSEHAMEHLLEGLPGLKLLSVLGQPASLLGTAWMFLGGAHKGIKWAGIT